MMRRHRPPPWRSTLMLCLSALTLWGCGMGDATLDEVDPEAAPANPTWSAHVERIMEVRCTACHDPDAQPGEASGYGFETCEKARRYEDPFIRTAIDEKTMPPGGAERLTSAEALTMLRWYAQGAPCD